MRFLIPLILILLITGCAPANLPEAINNDIDSIIHKWVPDQREGICSVKLFLLPHHSILVKGETNMPEAKAEIRNYITRLGYGYSDSLTVLPETEEIKKPWGLISLSVCNIKKSPSHSSELVSQALMGTPFKILKKKGSWLLIQTPDHYIGWVNNSGIAEFTESEMSNWRHSARVIFIKNSGYIVSGDHSGQVVSDIVRGAILEKKSEKNNSCIIVLPDGRRGALSNIDIRDFREWSETAFPEPEEMISVSRSLLGIPYLWGGTSTKAFDCSGFVRTIYFNSGLILARDASQQFLYGEPVKVTPSFDSLRKGDLIFFGNRNDGKERIVHTGMYIGDTEVIHCSGMVRINSLDSTRSDFSKYLKETLIGVKRIIGTESGKGAEKIASNSWYFINHGL
jgi:hypothetical protein